MIIHNGLEGLYDYS